MKWYALIIGLLLLGCSTPQEPQVAFPQVGMEEIFFLEAGDRVHLADSPVGVELRRLIHSPCFLTAQCEWDGRAIHIYLYDGDERTSVELMSTQGVYTAGNAQIQVIDSDFSEKAAFIFLPAGREPYTEEEIMAYVEGRTTATE